VSVLSREISRIASTPYRTVPADFKHWWLVKVLA